jgi:hypothetical protein
MALAPWALATEPPAPSVRCGTPRFLAPPPVDGHVVVYMPLGVEPGGRPVSAGVFVGVPADRDRDAKDTGRPPGNEPSLPAVDSPDVRFDVAIEIFERGDKDAGGALPASLHRAEARFLALELRRALEDSGHWGTVRVVPASGEGFDIVVTGRILRSSRRDLEVEVEARDALGRRLAPRTRSGEGEGALPTVMSGIASDLVAWRDEGPKPNLSSVRAAAMIRFGAQLAPETFERYLPPPRGTVPAPDPKDPLVQRLQRVLDRDQTFLTILNRHYAELHDAMVGPYADWRADSRSAEQATAALANLEAVSQPFDAPGPPSVVKAEGYEKILAGSVEGQFLAWRRLARRAIQVERAVVQ